MKEKEGREVKGEGGVKETAGREGEGGRRARRRGLDTKRGKSKLLNEINHVRVHRYFPSLELLIVKASTIQQLRRKEEGRENRGRKELREGDRQKGEQKEAEREREKIRS